MLALILFFLGLMSKTAIVILPAALLVIFWWKRGEVSPRRRALTKRCAWRVVSGTRVGPAQRRTSAMALARSQRWPIET